MQRLFENKKLKFKWQIIDTYILKKMIFSFFFSLMLLLVIIVVFDFSENISRFLENDYSAKEIIFGYYLNFIPYFINLFIPLFTFISVIWFTSQLTSRTEIVAMLSGGISFYRLIVPYFTGALILSVFAFFMANTVVPNSAKGLNAFKEKGMKKFASSRSSIHVRNDANSYVFLERWDINNQVGYGFTYEVISSQFISYKLTARDIIYNDTTKRWRLENYTLRTVSNIEEKVTFGETMDTIFNLSPIDFSQDVRIAEEMTYRELKQQIKIEKEKGSGLRKYFVMEKNKRLANSFGTFIMTFLGFTIASRKTQRGTGVHIFCGVALAFIFIFFQQISTVFSVSGAIPAALGIWIPNFIFMVICAVMVYRAQK